MRESSIERYFTRQVKVYGGIQRKLTTPGKRGASDRLVGWRFPYLDFVELKATGEKPKPHQVREHKRWRDRGFAVFVINRVEQVDRYIEKRA